MADLLERWAALWRVGLQDAWQQYASAQESLLAYGRSQTGQTPASVIYEEGRMRVLRYEPQGDSRSAGPLLCIPSLINRYYVMDLTPERSLIRSLLLQGVDVYMLDWGTATDVDRHRPLDEYIAGLLGRATAAVQDAGGHRRISLLGYCMGGVMAAVYAALRPGDVATLINLAGPVNYHDDGIYSLWTRAVWLDPDLMVDALGNIPAALLNATFNMVRPSNELLQALNYAQRHDDDSFLRSFAAMQLWLNDPTPFPGEAFRRYVKDLYQQNLLVQGRFEIHGRPIDLRTIEAPALTIAARRDHIAPWRSVQAFHDMIASKDKEMILLDSGHIGMVVGSDAQRTLWPRLGTWLLAHTSTRGR